VSAALEQLATLGHEEVVLVRERRSGLVAVIAIHDSRLGPAVGGTRMRPYPSLDDAVADALRLSRAMTYKTALAELPYGGGKAVIVGDPARDKSRERLRAYGAAVERLGGRFFTAGDMGIGPDDLAVVAQATRHVSRLGPQSEVDPSDLAGLGVYHAIRGAARFLGRPMRGLRVVVQGLGKVGHGVAERLAAEGALLALADLDRDSATRVARELGARVVDPAHIWDEPCDVLSPNAAGGVLDTGTIARLHCRAVVGGANDQLASPDADAALTARGVLWAPDYVASAGGVLSLLYEKGGRSAADTRAAVAAIEDRVVALFTRAVAEGRPPGAIATRMVEERLSSRPSPGRA
jgi:leucine dehydrogenase